MFWSVATEPVCSKSRCDTVHESHVLSKMWALHVLTLDNGVPWTWSCSTALCVCTVIFMLCFNVQYSRAEIKLRFCHTTMCGCFHAHFPRIRALILSTQSQLKSIYRYQESFIGKPKTRSVDCFVFFPVPLRTGIVQWLHCTMIAFRCGTIATQWWKWNAMQHGISHYWLNQK